MPLPRIRTAIFLLTFSISTALASSQTLKIDKIEFEGLNQRSASDVTTITALKPGETFSVEALDAAAQRLIDSGFFKKVAYKTKATKSLITITFVVEEAKVEASPAVFDNFIWFSDTELIVAIQRDVPTFTGTVPDTGDSIEKIVKALQRFLHENKIEATVTHMASQDRAGSLSQEHVFSVNGIPMPICSIHFPGFSNIEETRLLEQAKALRGDEYSAKFVGAFAEKNLLPLYYEVGQLKAKFAPPQGKPEETATCKNGVEVTIPIYEGAVYNFDKAEWIGNKSLPAQELDATLGVKTGQIANGLTIEKADRLIKKAYARKGYLTVSIQRTPQFSDESRKVSYQFQITEGPQYRMGTLMPKGFNDSETKLLQQTWGLKSGAVFDAGYQEEFVQTHMGEVLGPRLIENRNQGKVAPSLKWDYKPNRETLSVDITVELVN